MIKLITGFLMVPVIALLIAAVLVLIGWVIVFIRDLFNRKRQTRREK